MFRKIKAIEDIAFKKLKSKKKSNELKKTAKHFTLDDIVADLKQLGIKQGDVIMIYSSLRSIGYVENGPNTVIDAFLDAIGQEGTLIVPTYSNKGTMYETCVNKNYVFDLKKSKTQLGSIPSTFLKREGIYRSIHPTHSTSAIGKNAKNITETHHIGNQTYGENSPWGKLIKFNGKVLGIGVSLHPNAQYHYLENIMNTDFPLKVKVDDIYKLKCKNEKNKIIEVEVQPLDPNISKTRIDQKESYFIREYFWELFEKSKILKIGKIGEATTWWVDAKECFEFLVYLAKLGITIYSTKEDLKNKELYPFELIKDKIRNR